MRARTLPTSHPQQLQAAHKDHTLRQRHANVRANKTRAAKHLMGDPMPGGGGLGGLGGRRDVLFLQQKR